MRIRLRPVACITIVAVMSVAAASAQERLVIRAKAYLAADGSLTEDAVVIVNKGKIEDIGSNLSIPPGAFELDRSDAVIGPGLVDPHVSMGAMGRTLERANAAEPNANSLNLFNPDHPDFARALRAGVTTVVIAPSETQLIGGVTAVVKTGGDAAKRYLGEGPVKLSLTSSAFSMRRTPTNLQGALADIRQRIAAARENADDHSAFANWARGDAPALVELNDAPGISALADFSKEQGVRCVAVHGNQAAERIDAAKRLGAPFILGTYEFSDPRRYTRGPAMLAEAGVPFALTSNAPRYAPDWLRLGAVIAMRQGLSRADAVRGVTTTAAEIAGVSDRVGVLDKGLDADFVVYSGDPLDLRSRILEVFINGERVYVADAPPTAPEDDEA